jgi:hypothetical protein
LPDPEFEIPEFSYRTRRRTPEYDPLMRRIAFAAGGVAALVILVALVWSGMKPGISFGPPPVIEAPAGPLRVAPADPGGLTVPGADQQIMSGQSSAAPSELAPAAAAPDISAFQPPPAPPAPAQAAPPPAASASTAPARPAPAASALALVPAAINRNIQVQLAAAVDPAGARTAWAQLNHKMPGLLSGHAPIYSHTTVAGVEFWRLRVSGFTDIAAARQFCEAVKAQGSGCTVAAF